MKMSAGISEFYARPIGIFRAQIRTENPRKHEGVLRNGLPFSKDAMPDCVEGEPHHRMRSHQASIGARHGVDICDVCGLGSVYDSA